MINVLKALGLLLVLLLAYLVYFAQTSQTDYNFILQSETVSAPVEVVFDDMAVPHIYAERESDAMFALGYVHVFISIKSKFICSFLCIRRSAKRIT